MRSTNESGWTLFTATIVIVIMLLINLGIFIGLFAMVCWAFGWEFSYKYGFGAWIIYNAVRSIFKRGEKS